MPSVEAKISRAEPAPAPLQPLAVRIPTAMQLIGVRRSTVYALIKAGELRTVKLGRATLITMSSLRALVEHQGSDRLAHSPEGEGAAV